MLITSSLDATTPPYWFWPRLDDWQRKFGWRMSNDQSAQALFDTMLDRLKKFVDRDAQRRSDVLRLPPKRNKG
jgi:hypothetical protein